MFVCAEKRERIFAFDFQSQYPGATIREVKGHFGPQSLLIYSVFLTCFYPAQSSRQRRKKHLTAVHEGLYGNICTMSRNKAIRSLSKKQISITNRPD